MSDSDNTQHQATSQTVSVDEAARQLGISRSLAYAAIADGTIPSIRIGRRILVPKAALLAVLTHSAVTLTTPENDEGPAREPSPVTTTADQDGGLDREYPT